MAPKWLRYGSDRISQYDLLDPGCQDWLPGSDLSLSGLDPELPGLDPGMPGMDPVLPGRNPGVAGLDRGLLGVIQGCWQWMGIIDPGLPGLRFQDLGLGGSHC